MKASADKNGRTDRRVQRTRTALLQSLVELIVEKGYDQTSVQDVLDRANVGRSTFYSHFYCKEDLLLGRMTFFQLPVDAASPSDDGCIRMPDVSFIYRHVAEQRDMYLAIKGSPIFELTMQMAREDLAASFLAMLERPHLDAPFLETHHQFLAQSLAGAFIQSMLWWLDAGMPESPESMNRKFGRLADQFLNSDQ